MKTSPQTPQQVPPRAPAKRQRFSALPAALGTSPLVTCFTRTGFLAKAAQWSTPTLSPAAQKMASIRPGSSQLEGLVRMRDAIVDGTPMGKLDFIRVVDCALHVCVTRSRAVRYQVALGALRMVASINAGNEKEWGTALHLDRNAVQLQRLGIPGMGPLTLSELAQLYEDTLLEGPAYASHALTAACLSLLREGLLYSTRMDLPMGPLLAAQKPAACALLGMGLLASPTEVPHKKVQGFGPWSTDASLLVRAREGLRVTLDFQSPTHACLVFSHASRPWTLCRDTFWSLSAALLCDGVGAATPSPSFRVTKTEDGSGMHIHTPSGACKLRFETFRNLQSVLAQIHAEPLTARWTRYYELSRGVC